MLTGVQRGSVQYLQVCPGNPYDNLDCVPEGTNITGVLIPSIPGMCDRSAILFF